DHGDLDNATDPSAHGCRGRHLQRRFGAARGAGDAGAAHRAHGAAGAAHAGAHDPHQRNDGGLPVRVLHADPAAALHLRLLRGLRPVQPRHGAGEGLLRIHGICGFHPHLEVHPHRPGIFDPCGDPGELDDGCAAPCVYPLWVPNSYEHAAGRAGGGHQDGVDHRARAAGGRLRQESLVGYDQQRRSRHGRGQPHFGGREYMAVLQKPQAMTALTSLGVDVEAALDYGKLLFEDGEKLTFGDFMRGILTLRGSNQTTVKDIVDLRKFTGDEFSQLHEVLSNINQCLAQVPGPAHLPLGAPLAVPLSRCSFASSRTSQPTSARSAEGNR
ncbi:unnamed protein product, partial [Effrenium voratum]